MIGADGLRRIGLEVAARAVGALASATGRIHQAAEIAVPRVQDAGRRIEAAAMGAWIGYYQLAGLRGPTPLPPCWDAAAPVRRPSSVAEMQTAAAGLRWMLRRFEQFQPIFMLADFAYGTLESVVGMSPSDPRFDHEGRCLMCGRSKVSAAPSPAPPPASEPEPPEPQLAA